MYRTTCAIEHHVGGGWLYPDLCGGPARISAKWRCAGVGRAKVVTMTSDFAATVRIVQLTDTHFLEEGAAPEGGFAYDTAEAFDAVLEHVAGARAADLIVVTGDVADHGRPAQYQRAAAAFERFGAPVNVCPGNHDQDVAFSVGMGRTGVGTSRAIEIGDWCFLFVDSNAGVMVLHESGRHVDPSDPLDRLHRHGSLGERETAWIRDMCATTQAEHVFIWVHHPPGAPVGLTEDAAYVEEWVALLPDLPKVRGLGGGHTHVPVDYILDGCPVFVAPSLKHNFDLTAETVLPPGYRTYEFALDGTIRSELHLVEDSRWPRHRLPQPAIALLNGELTFAEFEEMMAVHPRPAQ